jgi:hypothetical protein
MDIQNILTSAANSATGSLSWFFPTLAAAIVYFQYEVMDPESQPINVPSELLLPSYDFIIVGAGSAGSLFLFPYHDKSSYSKS